MTAVNRYYTEFAEVYFNDWIDILEKSWNTFG